MHRVIGTPTVSSAPFAVFDPFGRHRRSLSSTAARPWRELGAAMHDALEIEPIDPEGMEEIRLVADLMIATATTRERLSTAAVDRVLGVAAPESPRRR